MKRTPAYTFARIWSVVERIPLGYVATYGDVAQGAGIPGRARSVGYALHALPPGIEIPWHRVINGRGTISLSGHAAREQARRLRVEGIPVVGMRIDLKAYRWRGGNRSLRH